MESILKHLACIVLLLASTFAYSKTLSSVSIAPQGAVLQSGSTLSFSAICSYADSTTDNCAAAGGATWSTSTSSISVSTLGRATASGDPGAGAASGGYVVVSAGGLSARAGLFIQHPGDTWYRYTTPSYQIQGYSNNVAVGSTVTVGQGFVIDHSDGGHNGNPINDTCAWASSDTSKATVDRQGLVTAVAPGSVNITCNIAGNAVWGNSTVANWTAPGNFIALNIVNGGTGNTTWYVRPDGGLPWVNATETPYGQCTGKTDAAYTGGPITHWISGQTLPVGYKIADDQGDVETVTSAGTTDAGTRPTFPVHGSANGTRTTDGTVVWTKGDPYPVNQACAVGNLTYLWSDMYTYEKKAWMIQGGDTVIVRQKAGGYGIGSDTAATYSYPSACYGDSGNCHMDPIPSGTPSHHTRILGENYASCSADSAKTQLVGTMGQYFMLNLLDSQNVDVQCLELTDHAACGGGSFVNHPCGPNDSPASNGIFESALTSNVTYKDLFIHGLTGEGIHGATGVGVVADHVHLRGNPGAGMDMDSSDWGMGNISLSGGLTMTYSTTEFSGCVEEYPVVHNYPYIECRDQNTGGYGDGLGTGSATGDWSFDHDTWRYNFQDGLDLLHSGMNSLSITNSISYGNDGQQWKVGSGKTVIFRNNLTVHNCARILQTIGDEPASAIVPNVAACRAGGDGIFIAFDGQGTDIFQNNSYVGYGATSLDMACTGGWEHCEGTNSIFENNIFVGLDKVGYNNSGGPGMFYQQQNANWAVRDHNLYFGMKNGPGVTDPLLSGEIHDDAKWVNDPGHELTDETTLDNFNFNLTSDSPAAASGITIPDLLTDFLGLTRSGLISMGGIQYGGTTDAPVPTAPTITLSATPGTTTAGQTVSITASLLAIGNVVPTGTVSFMNGSAALGTATLTSSGVATLSLSSLPAGSYSVVASYPGDTNYAAGTSSQVSLTINAATPPPVSAPPPVTTPPATPPPGSDPPPVAKTVTIAIAQPEYGFNVIPSATRRIFATVTNGSTNEVTWAVKSGGARISSNSGPWVDVTAPTTGSACTVTGSSANYTVTSGKQFTIEATSVDDPAQKADVTFNVCNPSVEVSLVPFYRTLYANQAADVQSFVIGSVNPNVHWSITSQPTGGDGSLTDSTSRDTVFTATVAGRYQLTAVSSADSSKSATAIMYVTGNKMPSRVIASAAQPVDCTVDPALLGHVYDVGPSQSFKTLAAVPFATMIPGSTVRLHNEDTTGQNPTVYHEYVQISQAATADQPFRLCGVPDKLGNLPVIDGANATGSRDISTAGQGLLTLHRANDAASWPNFTGPQYVVVAGIKFRDANPNYSYTAPDGSSSQWKASSACIQVDEAQNVVIAGNDIGSCSNGVATAFDGSNGWGASDLNILWEGNDLHDNGVAGSNVGQQMDLQSWNDVVQFNHIDHYAAGALGANIKSRGLQDVIRYNYLGEGAQRELDLVDVKGAPAYMSFSGYLGGGASSFLATHSSDPYPVDRIAAEQEAWNSHFVYGNIYQSTSSAPIHFSMDTAGGELARKGSLYWYNNTFYQKACSGCSGPWTLFDTMAGNGASLPQTEFPTVQAYNNIVWMDNAGTQAFQWNDTSSFIGIGGGNMLPSNWGSDLMTGGSGTGWSVASDANVYQNSLPLSAHVTGFDTGNILTSGSIPFNQTNWMLNGKIDGTRSFPPAVCQMPDRFAYLPTLGRAVPRAETPSVGATDTVSETAALMRQVAGGGRYNTRYSTCR
jgi:hypothetical protein